MGKYEKLLEKIVRGTSDADVGFDELCHLLIRLGFEEKIRGSHHIFRKTGIMEMPNLQKAGRQAKPYQVRQVRNIIVRYKLDGSVKTQKASNATL